MAPPPSSEHPSDRWQRQVDARLAGLRPWLIAFWVCLGVIASGVTALYFLPRD